MVSDLRLGYSRRVGNFELSPFVGVNNLFDEEYTDNLRINANPVNAGPTVRRFFEPAPKRNAYGGLRVSYYFSAR